MKKYYALILLIATFVSKGQINSSWPDSSACWVNTLYTPLVPWPVLSSVDAYKIASTDTVINGLTYDKIVYLNGTYKGGWRKDNSRILYVPKDSVSEFLLYDFGVQVGDTLREIWMDDSWGQPGQDSLIVTRIDTVIYGGIQRRRIEFSFASATWIEGIGNTQGLFKNPYPNISNFVINLECFSLKATAIYPSYDSRPCDIPLIRSATLPIDVYAWVRDTAGAPLPNYRVYIGEGVDTLNGKGLGLTTNSQGVAHGQFTSKEFWNLHAYVYDCQKRKVVDHAIGLPKTSTDSTVFEFELACVGDSCDYVLVPDLVRQDSNLYSLDFDAVGVGPMIITPTWRDGTGKILGMHPMNPISIPPGWFVYCIDLGCAPDFETCDSVYVQPDCQPGFYYDPVNSGNFQGKTVFWQNYRPGAQSYSYLWDFGDGNTSTQAFPSHTYAQPGTYRICLTMSYNDGYQNCSNTFCRNHTFDSSSVSLVVLDPSIGVDEYGSPQASLYPNPTRRYVNIELEGFAAIESLSLFDINGKLIQSWEGPKGDSIRLDLQNIPSGTYLLKLRDRNSVQAVRILKE